MIASYFDHIKGRCRVDEITGCWVWTGALSAGCPRIYAPDFSMKPAGTPRVQNGTRAMWHAFTGRGIPRGHRVYHAGCSNQLCINPGHLKCGPTAHVGNQVRASGILRDRPARIKANREIGRARSKVTPELAKHIVRSEKTGEALAIELNISRSIISRVRRGTLVSVLTVGNPFGGLL